MYIINKENHPYLFVLCINDHLEQGLRKHCIIFKKVMERRRLKAKRDDTSLRCGTHIFKGFTVACLQESRIVLVFGY